MPYFNSEHMKNCSLGLHFLSIKDRKTRHFAIAITLRSFFNEDRRSVILPQLPICLGFGLFYLFGWNDFAEAFPVDGHLLARVVSEVVEKFFHVLGRNVTSRPTYK